MEISAIWLRRIGDRVEVLIEEPGATGSFKLAIREFAPSPFSHIIEEAGLQQLTAARPAEPPTDAGA